MSQVPQLDEGAPGHGERESDRSDSSGKDRTCGPKLYVLARTDLEVGLRTAQVGHALIAWVLEFGRPPDNLVVLAVPDEETLIRVADRVARAGVRYSFFFEPDLGDEPTSAAIGPEGRRLLSSLPLLR